MIVLTASAFVTTLPFVAAEFAYGAGILPDSQGWAIIGYTAIFPSVLSQVFYIRGVELIGANRAGLFINLVPIFGTLLSIIILGEDFRAYPRHRHGAGVRRHLACRDQRTEDGDGLNGEPAQCLRSHPLDVELQPLRRLDRLVGPHLLQDRLGERRIEIEQRDSVAARTVTAEREVRDVDAVFTAHRAEQTNDPRRVGVGRVEHVAADFRVEVDALDLDEARLVVGEAGAGDRPRPDARS